MSMQSNASVAAPGTLASFTRPELILPRLLGTEPAGVIHELSRALRAQEFIPDLLPFYHAALNQELMASSALRNGLAIPHARLGGIQRLQFAFGRTAEPVPWGSRGASPTQLIFLVAIPSTDAVKYLHLLSSLARLGQQPDLLEDLRSAEDSVAIYQVLEKVKLRDSDAGVALAPCPATV